MKRDIKTPELYELFEKIDKKKICETVNASDSMWSKYKSTGDDHRDGFLDKDRKACEFTFNEKMRAIRDGDLTKLQLIEKTQDQYLLMMCNDMDAGIYIPQRELRARDMRLAIYTISQMMDYLKGYNSNE